MSRPEIRLAVILVIVRVAMLTPLLNIVEGVHLLSLHGVSF